MFVWQPAFLLQWLLFSLKRYLCLTPAAPALPELLRFHSSCISVSRTNLANLGRAGGVLQTTFPKAEAKWTSQVLCLFIIGVAGSCVYSIHRYQLLGEEVFGYRMKFTETLQAETRLYSPPVPASYIHTELHLFCCSQQSLGQLPPFRGRPWVGH